MLLTVAALAVSFGAFAGAGPVDASAYPPTGDIVTVDPDVGLPGFTARVVAPCSPGESVLVGLGDESARGVCDETGTATFSISAPADPGVHEGDVSGTASGSIGSFAVTVEVAAAAAVSGESIAVGSTESDSSTVLRIFLIALASLAVVAAVAQRQRMFA